MKRSDLASAQCWFGPQSARATRAACDTMSAISQKLGKTGWCWGRDESFGKVYRWHRCDP